MEDVIYIGETSRGWPTLPTAGYAQVGSMNTKPSPTANQSLQPPSSWDWQRIRPLVIDLYLHQNLSLREVRSSLMKNFGFEASEDMYDYHLKRWGLSKDSQRGQNHGHYTLTTISNLNSTRPYRLPRSQNPPKSDQSPPILQPYTVPLKYDSHHSPDMVDDFTLAPDKHDQVSTFRLVVMSPDETELLFSTTKNYLAWYLDSLSSSGQSLDTTSIMGLQLGNLEVESTKMSWPGEPLSLIERGGRGLSNGDTISSFSRIEKACQLTRRFLLRQYPTTLTHVAQLLEFGFWNTVPELKKMVFNFISSMAKTLLGSHHPLAAVLSSLLSGRIHADVSKRLRTFIIDTLRQSRFKIIHLFASIALNQVGIMSQDGVLDESHLQSIIQRHSLLSLVKNYTKIMQEDVPKSLRPATSLSMHSDKISSYHQTPSIQHAGVHGLDENIECAFVPAGSKIPETSQSKNVDMKVVQLLRTYVILWSGSNKVSRKMFAKAKKVKSTITSPSSIIQSKNSLSSIQDNSELNEINDLTQTPQTSVSTSQISPGNISDGEMSFIDTNNDSNIDSALFENDTAFLHDLARRILLRCLEADCTPGIHTRAGRQANQSKSSPSDLPTPSSFTSVTQHKKRHLTQDDEADDFDDKEHNRNPCSKRARTDESTPLKLFACPFWKHDPERYSASNLVEREKCYRGCSSIYLKDISRLKQHLWRVHRKPDYFCCICFDSFKSQTLLFNHMKQKGCNEREDPFQERISEEQYVRIKRRNKNGDPIGQWYEIFRILFPGGHEPCSPYADGNSSVDHFAALFRWFGPEIFLNMVRDRRDQGGPPLEMSTRLIALEAFERALPGFLEHQRHPFGASMDDEGPRSVESDAPEPPTGTTNPPPPFSRNAQSAVNRGFRTSDATTPIDSNTVLAWDEVQYPEYRDTSFDMAEHFQEQMLGWAEPIDPTEAYHSFDIFAFDAKPK